jgi:signal transduction histidine kinase
VIARLGLPRRDVAIAATIATVFVVELAVSNAAHGPFALDALLYGTAALSLAWRRRRPVASMVVCLSLAGIASLVGTGVTEIISALLFVILPAYAVGHEAEGRRGWAGLALGLALMIGATLASDQHQLDNIAFPAGIMVAAWTIGRLLRNRMLLTRTLADEAARLELDRDLRAQAAVGEERARIAREMHDVVAHTMAIMVVQAGGARSVLARDPAAAEQALATVEETGRVALTELRRMLGFLRSDGPAELVPQPSLDGLGALVQRARDSGLPVELRVEGERFDLQHGAELAAYRIVQEALTNSLKHAGPGARATVTLRWVDENLEISVTDTGGKGAAGEGTGLGLIGMRERVTMMGGELTARPRPAGGFAVRALIPCCKTEVTA